MKSRLQLYTAPADGQLSSAVSRKRCKESERERGGRDVQTERERARDKYKAVASYACVEPAIVNYKFRRETDKKECVRERENERESKNANMIIII